MVTSVRGVDRVSSDDSTRTRISTLAGRPVWPSPIIAADRWDYGDTFLTASFSYPRERLINVTVGLGLS